MDNEENNVFFQQPCGAWQETILDSIADGVFTVDNNFRITYFNRAAEKITGVSSKDAIGRHCWEVFRANVCEGQCYLRSSLESGEPGVHNSAYIIDKDGNTVPINISTAPIKDAEGKLIGGVETFRSLAELETLRKELTNKYTFEDIVTKNKKMRQLLDLLPRLAMSDATVLIEGASGTGKELFARALHNLSNRSGAPLVTVNCAALPDTLLEAELFGHVAGAFTDAKKDRPGRFQQADGGTIFLDEIGDISPALQVRLLRVLQEKTLEPLGSEKTIKVDTRVITATNKHLQDLVDRGSFREDLFYRLNVMVISIPPLLERRQDIPLLVDHFIQKFNRLHSRKISHMDPGAMALLMKHSFPGNVRELQNIIEHAYVLCQGGVLLAEHLPEYLKPQNSEKQISHSRQDEFKSLEEMESVLLRDILEKNDYNRQETAKQLGIHKTTLWRKMKKLGIQAPVRKKKSKDT